MKNEMQKVIKKLSKKFNKREQLINCMVEILKENYSLDEIEKLITEYMRK